MSRQRAWIRILSAGVLGFAVFGCGKLPDPQQTSKEPGELPWKNARLNPVTRVYGSAKIREGKTTAESRTKPWSSYWYPRGDASLFETTHGRVSPLQKYDEWSLKAKKVETGAAPYEKLHFMEGSFGENSAGLCSAWARASTLEKEPARSAKIDGVDFTIFDLKALLIKSYESAEGFRVYGSRYTGGDDDFDDLYPDQFHRFLQAELLAKRKPFLIDRDPGPQVWEVPVYRADVTIAKDPSNPYVMHVHTTLVSAGIRDDLDFVGTSSIYYNYDYDLFGEVVADGTFLVKSGAWTRSSQENHPDFVTAIPDRAVSHGSENPGIRNDLVREILEKSAQP